MSDVKELIYDKKPELYKSARNDLSGGCGDFIGGGLIQQLLITIPPPPSGGGKGGGFEICTKSPFRKYYLKEFWI